MSTAVNPQTPPPPAEKDDPWRLGWRYVPRAQADGKMRYEQVPLSQEDLLHPEEEDFIVNNEAHVEICAYLRNALFEHFAGRPDVVVLHDCRVDWGVAGVQPLGPDFSVFDNVHIPWERLQGTFHVAALDVRPLLAIEVTSPSTRNIDLDDKVDLYFRARIPLYAIVDLRPRPGGGIEVRMIGYRRDEANEEGYYRMRPDERGRLWLDTVRLWLAPEGETLVCYDESGRRLMDHVEAVQAVQTAQAQAETAETRAIAAETQARIEVKARESIEARMKELEAEVMRLRGDVKE